MFIFTSQNSNNMRYEYRYEMRGFDGPTTRDNFRPIKTLMRMQSRGEFLTKEEKNHITKQAEINRKKKK